MGDVSQFAADDQKNVLILVPQNRCKNGLGRPKPKNCNEQRKINQVFRSVFTGRFFLKIATVQVFQKSGEGLFLDFEIFDRGKI